MAIFSRGLVETLKNIVFDCNWQNLGPITQFEPMKCYKYKLSNQGLVIFYVYLGDFFKLIKKRLYGQDEIDENLILIRDKKDKFYAIDSTCSHEGFGFC
jgi:hypothetical protein